VTLLETRLDYLEAVFHERQDLQREYNRTYADSAERMYKDLRHLFAEVSALKETLIEHIQEQDGEFDKVSGQTDKERLASLKTQLAQYQRNLNTSQEQLAKRGPDQPLWLLNQIGDTRNAIETIKLEIEMITNDLT